MNPILLHCQCDSVVTKACGSFIPVVKETYKAGTYYEDVAIAQTICCAVVAIVLIGALAFLAWTLMQLHALKNVAVRKRQWDEEDKNRQDTANKENRQNMLEDEKRKRKNSFIDKKLEALAKDSKAYSEALENAITQISEQA